jgi:hypothetical protein
MLIATSAHVAAVSKRFDKVAASITAPTPI